MKLIASIIKFVVSLFQPAIDLFSGWLWNPRIESVSPDGGWPGSILTIEGSRFSPSRDNNIVEVGGVEALVLEAEENRLKILVGERASSGNIKVTVDGTVAAGSATFKMLPWPNAEYLKEDGPPVFYHGPEHGTPKLGVTNQHVLVIFCFPTDHPPGDSASQAALRSAEKKTFADANRFWLDASYGRSTWRFDFTQWIPLPKDRDFYMWQSEDIARARQDLLISTKRCAFISGNRIYATHLGMKLGVLDGTDPQNPTEVAGITGLGVPHAISVSGNRAFVASGGDGLFVLDTTSNPAAVIAHIKPGSWFHEIDISGNLLAVAARETGLELYDISNPAHPQKRGGIAFGDDWATAVRLVGSRAYIASGPNLRIIDVSNPAAPFELGNANTGQWGMGIDVEGTICGVATDGDGLHLYDVGGVTPVLLGVTRTALRMHSVDIVGGLAYAAAAAEGLRVFDISDPKNPAETTNYATGRECYHVVIDSHRAYLSLGARTLAIADLTDPRKPTPRGTVTMTVQFPFGFDPPLAALRDQLGTSIDSQGQMQRLDAFLLHSLQGAKAGDPALNFEDFEGIIAVMNGPGGRGASWLSNGYSFEGESVTFQNRKGNIWLTTGSTWGRKAHELGHWFGMPDIYSEWFSDGSYFKGTAEDWDLAGNHDAGPLFSGRQIHDVMHMFSGPNVVERTWTQDVLPLDETFEIIAHDAIEDRSNRIRLLKLNMAQGLIYYVEVRQKPGSVIFDQNIAAPNPVQGVVLVTKSTEGTTISNTMERPTELFGVLDVGGQVVDAARLMILDVEARVQDRPLVYRVRLRWNIPFETNPSGKFDLSITPWSTDTWESVDIWIDSPRNNPTTGAPIYEFHEPNKPEVPILNGDKPWVKHPNTIYARIRNSGLEAAKDVYVTFYVSSPPGIGDNGNWTTLGTTQVPLIAANSQQLVSIDWEPSVDAHTCIKVAIMPQFDEIEPKNNLAQENVAKFDSGSSSSHEPAILAAMVRSPFVVWRKVDMIVQALPIGWHAVVDHAWTWVGPHGEKPVRVVIWTDLHTARGSDIREIPSLALPRIEGWTNFDHRYLPIGGILAAVRANRKVELACEVFVDGPQLLVRGCLKPPFSGVPITVVIEDANGKRRYVGGITGSDGCCFLPGSGNLQEMRLAPGRYTVQVFSAATADVAEAQCASQPVVIRNFSPN